MFDRKYKFNLLARWSEARYNSQIFVDKCKNKGKTITIVKGANGNVFGAYTDLNFTGVLRWINGNKNTFLFAILDNKIIKC